MSFAIRTSRGEDLDRLAAFAATAQADPERFCAYLAETADGIAAELAEAADWPANGHVALDDQRNVVGWLVAETDADMGRVWWWGPFVGRSSTESALVADALLSTGLRDHPEREHELAADARSQLIAELAARHGFAAEEGSVVMVYERAPQPEAEPQPAPDLAEPAPDLAVSELGPGSTDVAAEVEAAVANLHDRLFPGTHTPGALLVSSTDERRRRWLVSRDGHVLGYVATELQADGSLYIDYLGVEPSARNVGLGRRLVRHALRHGDAGSDRLPRRAYLTVRVDNGAARALYASLGFAEQRIVVPYRRGFSLS